MGKLGCLATGVAMGLAIAAAPAAKATAFMNGSFEWGTNPGSSLHLAAGSTDITGWTVGGNSIDYVGGWWAAADGERSIDLSGSGAGSIWQTFDTVAGRKYTVSFYLAGNSDAGPLVKTMRVGASGNASHTYTFDASHSMHVNMGWIPETYSFTAAGSSTTLTFASLNEGVAGAAIDGVTLAAVPESGTWAMTVIGFGFLGAALRARRRPAPQIA